VWNCDLKTYISPPAATKEQIVDDEGLIEEQPDFLFEKRYDALTISANRTGNNLNGTCQLGQLLTRGYDQELRNGLHLRQAYFYDGNNTADEHAASDSRMRLWDLTKPNNEVGGLMEASTPLVGDPSKAIYQEPNLRYRADDEQRTLMSGQVLLRGLFEPELLKSSDDETAVIRLHTADFHLDVLGINKLVCPRAGDLFDEAYESDEYKKWRDNSMEVKTVTSYLKEKMGIQEISTSILDCLMTTMCTDRTLPDPLNVRLLYHYLSFLLF
jgi:ubiquitin-like domain-containing CTD phosphatase 1